MHRADLWLIGEEPKRGGLDAANSPDTDAELLGGGLKGGRRLAEQAETKSDDVTLHLGEPFDRVGEPIEVDVLCGFVVDGGLVRGEEVTECRTGIAAKRLVEACDDAGEMRLARELAVTLLGLLCGDSIFWKSYRASFGLHGALQ